MSAGATRSRGHTITEVMVAMFLLALLMIMVMGGWLYMVRGEKHNSVQAELDMDVRKTIEQIRSRLRLSTLEGIVFYRPPSAENFTAISFPLAVDSDGDGLIEMENSTNIIWDQTVIYHVWNRSPEQLRCTIFSPRNNSLTDAQVKQQLADVVTAGDGHTAIDSSNAATHVVFANLFDWKLWPKGSRFDSYSSSLKRELILFGSAMITPGTHTLTFQTTGKNTASSGYKIGLDYLRASPAGSDREAEWQSYSTYPGTITATRQYMSQGSWSDNYQMLLNANSSNQQIRFTIENDRWEDTTFRSPGSQMEGLSLKRDVASGFTMEENYLSMDGNKLNWVVENQLPDTPVLLSDNDFDECAIRVLMKGANIIDGGYIPYNGQYAYILFTVPSYFGLPYRRTRIKAVSLGMVDDSNGYTSAMNIKPGTMRRYYFPTGEILDSNYYAYPEVVNPYFQISRTNTYAVTFLIDALGSYNNGGVWARYDSSQKIHSYVLPNAVATDVYETNWSSKANLIATNCIPVVCGMWTRYPSNALYTSGIFDTTVADPGYQTMTWNEALGVVGSGYTDTPSGTSLRMQARSGDDPYLSDAATWSNAPYITSGGSLAAAGNGRYIQYRATLISDCWSTPMLRNVKMRWTGASRLADISAMVTRGPEYGEFEVLLDGTNLYKGVRIDLSIFKDVIGFGGKSNRMTSAMMAEVEPRNSGK